MFLNFHTKLFFFNTNIEYVGEGRYCRPFEADGKWWQIAFQNRLNSKVVQTMLIKQGTKPGTFPDDPSTDPNFKNSELEWIINHDEAKKLGEKWMVIYGIMIRFSDVHPKDLPQNAWWKNNIY
jgi:hypothetical protein